MAVTPTLWLADARWRGACEALAEAVSARCREEGRPDWLVWSLGEASDVAATDALMEAFGPARIARAPCPSPGGVATPSLDGTVRVCYAVAAWQRLREGQVAVLVSLSDGAGSGADSPGFERLVAAAHLRRAQVVEARRANKLTPCLKVRQLLL